LQHHLKEEQSHEITARANHNHPIKAPPYFYFVFFFEKLFHSAQKLFHRYSASQ